MKPTKKQAKQRDDKVKACIKAMGDKYLLAKRVGRLTNG
jgi:hypothetical protein